MGVGSFKNTTIHQPVFGDNSSDFLNEWQYMNDTMAFSRNANKIKSLPSNHSKTSEILLKCFFLVIVGISCNAMWVKQQ
jgi:hypothetical protein